MSIKFKLGVALESFLIIANEYSIMVI